MLTVNDQVARNIAGDITLAPDCADSMRKWRQMFGVKQSELASRLKVSPSVISDYESGRRASPGTCFVKRLVEMLISLDEENGSHVIKKLMQQPQPEAILGLKELTQPIKASKVVKLLEGEVIANKRLIAKRQMKGYTIIDSIQAILNLSDREFSSIYGSNHERALIFTKVKMGRSPMIAVKVTHPKPGMIVLHGLRADSVDRLAKHIAEKENIPLIVSNIESEEELIERLKVNLT